jgi:acryloyl-coenzyme A reductase
MDRYGPPDVLQVQERPEPPIGSDQVLVEVHACGVCGHDLLARAGRLGTPLPMVLGHEIAGVVVKTGSAVTELQVGQRVALVQRIPCGSCPDCRRGATNVCRRGPGFYGDDLCGGYAQYVVASPRNAVVLPDSIGFEQGAVLSCGVGTGYRALRRAALREGDLVVVTAAGGGVGLHTVALAALEGYKVLAVTSSEHKRQALTEAGAAAVSVSPSGPELRAMAKDMTGGRGAEAAIEIAGPPTFGLSMAALAAGGRLVLVGNTQPRPVEMNPGAVIVRELEILGSAHATREDLSRVVSLVADGRIRPTVSVVRPLAEVGELHRAMEAREVTGRAALRVDQGS